MFPRQGQYFGSEYARTSRILRRPRKQKGVQQTVLLFDEGKGMDDPLHLVVEIKGYRREDTKEKKTTMDIYWVPGVNHLGKYGRWAFAEFTDVWQLQDDFAKKVEADVCGGGGGGGADDRRGCSRGGAMRVMKRGHASGNPCAGEALDHFVGANKMVARAPGGKPVEIESVYQYYRQRIRPLAVRPLIHPSVCRPPGAFSHDRYQKRLVPIHVENDVYRKSMFSIHVKGAGQRT